MKGWVFWWLDGVDVSVMAWCQTLCHCQCLPHQHIPQCSFTMTTNIHFKEAIKWPYGVMVSHQLDVLRVPRSILGEANLFLFLFSHQNPSLVCFVHHSFFIFLQQQNDMHHNHRNIQANTCTREQVWTGALVCFLWW